MSEVQNPAPDMSGAGPVEYRPAEGEWAEAALRSNYEDLMAIPGVTFVGASDSGLLVGVLDSGVAAQLPRAVDGVPVTVTVTGPVEALPGVLARQGPR
jgi:hypothetical protein